MLLSISRCFCPLAVLPFPNNTDSFLNVCPTHLSTADAMKAFVLFSFDRVSTTPGNPGNLLEFNGPPGNFCVR